MSLPSGSAKSVDPTAPANGAGALERLSRHSQSGSFQQNLDLARDPDGHSTPVKIGDNVYRSQDEENRKKALAVIPYGSELWIRFFDASSLQAKPDQALESLVHTALVYVDKQPDSVTQVHFQVEGPIPMAISISRQNQTFSVTLHVSSELKKELAPHMANLGHLLEQKLDQRHVDIQLSAQQHQSSGGRQNRQQQGQSQDSETNPDAFQELMKL